MTAERSERARAVAGRTRPRIEVARALSRQTAAIAALRRSVADRLTALHGKGHWSFRPSDESQARALASGLWLVATIDGRPVGTLCLVRRKPWAIDPAYFTPARRPLHLVDLAVDPAEQGGGIGRALVAAARLVAREEGADAIRLDAYDGPAGAGGFYTRAGLREVGRKTYRGVPLVYFEDLLEE